VHQHEKHPALGFEPVAPQLRPPLHRRRQAGACARARPGGGSYGRCAPRRQRQDGNGRQGGGVPAPDAAPVSTTPLPPPRRLPRAPRHDPSRDVPRSSSRPSWPPSSTCAPRTRRAPQRRAAARRSRRGSLLSILRLAQAYGASECGAVQQHHVDEAIRLISVSKASVTETDSGERAVDSDYVSRIWALLRDKAIAERKGFGAWAGVGAQRCGWPRRRSRPLPGRALLRPSQCRSWTPWPSRRPRASARRSSMTCWSVPRVGLLELNASMTRIQFAGSSEHAGFEDL